MYATFRPLHPSPKTRYISVWQENKCSTALPRTKVIRLARLTIRKANTTLRTYFCSYYSCVVVFVGFGFIAAVAVDVVALNVTKQPTN